MNREKQILAASYLVVGLLVFPMLAWSVASGPVLASAKEAMGESTPQASIIVLPTAMPVVAARILDSWSPTIARWGEIINIVAELYQLDPDLIAAVMMMESGGNPEAHGRSGEFGLMQIMPYHSCVSWEPAQNIDCGAQILARNIERAGGDARAGLAAYNAGETGRDRDGKGWDYADKVLALYHDAKEKD